jgi:hypothetical protein
MDIGQPARRTLNDWWNGTLDLFAALNVATGEVHVVLDNLSAHRARRSWRTSILDTMRRFGIRTQQVHRA